MNKRALWLALAIGACVASPATAQEPTITLVGAIVDSVSGQPVPNVEVYVPEGTTSFTNKDGRFRLLGVSRTNPLVFARRIGFRRRAVEVNPQSGNELDLGRVWIAPMYFALDTIKVEAEVVRTNPKLSEFYRRRKSGMGQYLTLTEIQKRNPMFTTDLFRSFAGVVVRCEPGAGCSPMTFRRGSSGRTCPMRVILDGMPVRDFELDLISPSWIAGIEIYKSGTWTPLELGKSACGTVVVWTGGER